MALCCKFARSGVLNLPASTADQPAVPTFGKSSRGSAFLLSKRTVLPFKVSSTASTMRSIWETPAHWSCHAHQQMSYVTAAHCLAIWQTLPYLRD